MRVIAAGIAIALFIGGVVWLWNSPLTHKQTSILSNTVSSNDYTYHGQYFTYNPKKFSSASLKRAVIFLQPGGDDAEARQFVSYWKEQADANGLLIVGIPDWGGEQTVPNVVRELRSKEGVDRIYISGFSNGGYNACHIGLGDQTLFNGIIPMASFCKGSSEGFSDLPKGKVQNLPILDVIGEKDTWALGDDGTMAKRESAGLQVEWINVPGLGHDFPITSMPKIGNWIMAH